MADTPPPNPGTPPALGPAASQAVRAAFEAAAGQTDDQRADAIAAAGLDAAGLAELMDLLASHDASRTGQGFLVHTPADQAQAGAAQPGQRLGAWQVVQPLGAGGMGEVFEARRADGRYEGRAAIKLLKRGLDSAAVLERFALERQALARLNHPHIARLLDAGATEAGQPYFVLELVEGRPIDQAARDLPRAERLALFLQLTDAVSHAHRQMLVHRDLKPGNVLVDCSGQVKLLDFGIAKALDPLEGLGPEDAERTVGGERPFTPQYASPDQVRGEPVTTATDIYSLGVLLNLLLSGVRPYGREATTPQAAARSVLEEDPTRPSALSPGLAADPQWLATRKRLAGDLDNILLKALDKRPEQRYPTALPQRGGLRGRPARPPGGAARQRARPRQATCSASSCGGTGPSWRPAAWPWWPWWPGAPWPPGRPWWPASSAPWPSPALTRCSALPAPCCLRWTPPCATAPPPAAKSWWLPRCSTWTGCRPNA